MLRHLRLRRIAPLLLHKRLKSGEQVAIIDLLRFEESSRTVLVLPELFGFNQLASAIDSEW